MNRALQGLPGLLCLLALAASCDSTRRLPADGGVPVDGSPPADARAGADQRPCTPGLPGSWAVAASGTGDVEGFGLAVSAAGDAIALTGKLAGEASFGASTVVAKTRESDAFIALANAAGELTWATTIADVAVGEYAGHDLAFDAAGELLAAGRAEREALFGDTLVGHGAGYVAKLTTAGAWRWVTPLGDSPSASAKTVALDAQGNIYVAGGLGASAATLGSSELSCPDPGDLPIDPIHGYVAKLGPEGAILWAVPLCTEGIVTVARIAVDGQGNSHVTGLFVGSLAVGPHEAASAAAVRSVGFVARLDPEGNAEWLLPLPSDEMAAAGAIVVDSAGDSVFAGSFGERLAIGATELSSPSGHGAFIAKLDPSGAPRWALPLEGAGVGGLALAPGDGIVAVLQAPTALDVAGAALPPPEEGGLLLLRIGAGGEVEAGVRGGGDRTHAAGVALDAAGDVIVAGTLDGRAWFGCTELAFADRAAFIWNAGPAL